MKQRKREYFPLYSYYDRSGIAKHLEAMAAKGWLLEKIGTYCWSYHQIEPKALWFAVTYFPKATQFDPYPADGLETFREFCAEAGWVLAADSAQVQVFYNENPCATPIETDPEAEFQTIHASMKKSFLSSYWLLFFFSLFEIVFFLWRLFDDPIGQFSSTLQLNSTLGFLPLAILATTELIRYYRWRKRCRTALEIGAPLPELRSARWLSVLILVLAAIQMLTLLSSSFQASRGMAITMILILLYFCLMFYLANGVRRALQHLHANSWVNRLITGGVIAALTIAMFSGITILVFSTNLFDDPESDTYEYKGHTFTVYHDDLPLTVADLVPDNYENWSTQLTVNSSPLLTHMEAQQRARLGEGDHPNLSYEIVIVKAPFLYDLCKQDFINWLERDNDKLPQEYWDEYRPVDPAPWGASEVYQRYGSGEPINQFLICWPDRIAEINFDWNWVITEEIVTVSARLLKAA